ncbi:stage II sporulation protein M, partial [Acetobacter persici]|uniref:stage II sporulation protein M n=1 Tax=Acetobacter persici TaxID=1076596 RepID=UPI0036DC008E
MLKSVKKLKFEIILTISIYVLAIILGAFIQIDTNKIEIPENTPTALAILKNNLKASIMLLFGLITLGITTCISLIINGTILGNVIMVNLKYLSGTEVLSRILPHGILEIPATILLAAVGFQTLKVVINLIRQKK